MSLGWWIVGGVVVAGVLANIGKDESSEERAAPSQPEASSARPIATGLPHYEVMPGNGYHPMGGVDGKDWGVWQSTGSTQPCTWSIRLTSPYTGATVLREGTSEPGQSASVSIQPPGDVSSLTGEINGRRVVFQTFGCGSWRVAS